MRWQSALGLFALNFITLASQVFAYDFCREKAANKEGYGTLYYQDALPYKKDKPDQYGAPCIATLACKSAANGLGYGDTFKFDGIAYKKIDANWANAAATNWCKLTDAPSDGPSKPSTENLFEHRGKHIFLTGVNIGNVQFIPFKDNPYGSSEEEMRNLLRNAFKDLAASGVNSYRFWLHVDGSRNPSFDSKGTPAEASVSGLPAGTIEDLQWLVRTAYQDYGLLININLWSHDVLGVRSGHPIESRDRVVRIFNDDAALQQYIDKALTPLVKAMDQKMPGTNETYKDAILSWEVFNEPEGVAKHWRLYWNYQYAMEYGDYRWRENSLSYLDDRRRSEFAINTGDGSYTPIKYKGWHFVGTQNSGFNLYLYKDFTDEYPSEWDFLKKAIVDDKALTTVEISYERVLRSINRIAGAIHRLDSQAKVSAGAHSIPYNTAISMKSHGTRNYYSDEELIAAGGDPQGTLDFYQVHGYPEWNDAEKDADVNMFKLGKAHWQLDKPLIVGEHWNIIGAQNEMLDNTHYEFLHDQGYAGVWGWAYFHVREAADPQTGKPYRWIDKHENQDYFRKVFQSLPERLRYKAR